MGMPGPSPVPLERYKSALAGERDGRRAAGLLAAPANRRRQSTVSAGRLCASQRWQLQQRAAAASADSCDSQRWQLQQRAQTRC